MATVAEATREGGHSRDGLGRARAAVLALVSALVAGAVIIGVVGVLAAADTRADTASRREDAAIREAVRAALRRDARIPVDLAVAVTVERGLVTLSGAVETYAQREAAEEDVARTAGALLVDNRLRVRPAGESSDRGLQGQIVAGLQHAGLTDDAEIAVVVAEGVATLRGTVRSLAAKRSARELAASHAGIREVRDLLAVEPPVRRADDEISAEVRSAIGAHPVLRDQPIAVRTEGGVVTLTGSVRAPTSVELAGELVVFTAGARGIDNRLAVRR